MEYRQLGRSGLTVSAVGLGCNNFGMRIDEEATAAVVHQSLESGITFFDTAEMYGGGKSEEFLGSALGKRRDEVVIATKFGGPKGPGPGQAPGSRRNAIRACEDSLRRLGTDYIDLYYQHYPDHLTPIDETLEALSDLVGQGKVRYIASSNVTGWQVADAHHLAGQQGLQRFTGCQIEWSLLNRAVETEIVPACRKFELGIVPYFPLASGLLTGKHKRGEPFAADSRMSAPYFASAATDENWDKIERLTKVAEASGRTILELAICWLLSQDGVSSVLTGATKAEQVVANVAAAEWRLSSDELAAVAEALAGG
ncbi:MAG: aldo/keto reductase [Actinomycetia bacterium]|nr:aldo/keto reductase [Actinomycetes bacterium]